MLLKEIHTEGEHLSNTADNVRVHTVGPIFLVHTLAIQIYCSDPLPKNLEASMQRTLLACFVFLFSLQQILVEKFFVWLSHPHTKSFRKTFSCILATHCHIHLVFSNSAILSCPPANEATSLGLMLSPSFWSVADGHSFEFHLPGSLYMSFNTRNGRAHQHIHTIQNVVGPSSTCDLPQQAKNLCTCKHWWWIAGQFMFTIYNCIHHWYVPWTSMGHVHIPLLIN